MIVQIVGLAITACFAVLVRSADIPEIPDIYTFYGKFSLPYANITQDITVWFDGKRGIEKVSHEHDADFTMYDGKTFYNILTNYKDKYCFKMIRKPEEIKDDFNYYTPDLKKFTKLDMLYEINGQMCNHYRLSVNDTADDPVVPISPNHGFDGTGSPKFIYAREDQQDFYCVEVNGICLPVRWEIRGYNTIQHSHYDYYVLDYDNFIPHVMFNEEDNFSEEKIKETVANHKCYDVDEIDVDDEVVKSYLDNEIFMSKMKATPTQSNQLLSRVNPIKKNLMLRKDINRHNKNYKKGKASYRLDYNKFGSLDYESFIRQYTGYVRPKTDIKLQAKMHDVNIRTIDEKSLINENGKKIYLPRELDWRKRGVLPPVKDQASCGSCWTFGAAGPIEGRINKLRIENEGYSNVESEVSISEQAIVDCMRYPDTMGCNGGNSLNVYEYMINDFKGKLPLAIDYPYIGLDLVCQQDKWTYDDYMLTGIDLIAPGNVNYMKRALLDGPVSVAIAVPPSMVYYAGGIYDDLECGNKEDDLVHAVVVEGWGVEESTGREYWIVRNSWSNAWGANGYIYILADEKNICGVLTEAGAPQITKKN